ncbi:MAG: TonB family protein [bacterium]
MFKDRTRQRMLYSTVVALLGLLALILFGPSRQDVKKRFEFSGAEGEMRIMPELSIDEGQDTQHQEEKFFQDNPPPPNVEVEPEETVDQADEFVPEPVESPVVESDVYADAESDPDLDVVDQIEMNLPQQTNPWFVLIRMVRPQYPSNATEADRRKPLVRVEVAFFVGEEGKVTASYIISSSGGPAFGEVVLKAVNEWLYKPVWHQGKPPQGFWNHIVIRFRSPYGSAVATDGSS